MLCSPSLGESHVRSRAMTKQSWSRLTTFLASEVEAAKVLSFQEIEQILGHALPGSALRHLGQVHVNRDERGDQSSDTRRAANLHNSRVSVMVTST